MITVFNGRSRGVGQQSREDVYIQVQVRLRSHLHLFKNARLAVFLAIALHSDKEGWSDPSIELLRSETGYNKDTIARALTDLCELTLDGQRVLLAAQQRQRGGVFAKNRYLVFPSPDECAKYETSGELRKPRIASYEPLSPTQPSSENQYTVVAQPSSENQYTAEIEVQSTPTPQNGDSPSIGFPSTVFPYGSITILKNHESPPPPPGAPTSNGGGGGEDRSNEKPNKTELYYWLCGEGGVDSPIAAERNQHHDPAATKALHRKMVGDSVGAEREKLVGRFIRKLDADGPPPIPASAPAMNGHYIQQPKKTETFVPITEVARQMREKRKS